MKIYQTIKGLAEDYKLKAIYKKTCKYGISQEEKDQMRKDYQENRTIEKWLNSN